MQGSPHTGLRQRDTTGRSVWSSAPLGSDGSRTARCCAPSPVALGQSSTQPGPSPLRREQLLLGGWCSSGRRESQVLCLRVCCWSFGLWLLELVWRKVKAAVCWMLSSRTRLPAAGRLPGQRRKWQSGVCGPAEYKQVGETKCVSDRHASVLKCVVSQTLTIPLC